MSSYSFLRDILVILRTSVIRDLKQVNKIDKGNIKHDLDNE